MTKKMINLIHSDQACVSLLDMKSQTKNLTIISIVQFKTKKLASKFNLTKTKRIKFFNSIKVFIKSNSQIII